MSDDGCCGDTGGDCCNDTGGGCDDTGKGCDDSGACMDTAECTQITLTENASYEGGYCDDGGDTFQPDNSDYSTNNTPTSSSCSCITITITIIAFLGELNFFTLLNL